MVNAPAGSVVALLFRREHLPARSGLALGPRDTIQYGPREVQVSIGLRSAATQMFTYVMFTYVMFTYVKWLLVESQITDVYCVALRTPLEVTIERTLVDTSVVLCIVPQARKRCLR